MAGSFQHDMSILGHSSFGRDRVVLGVNFLSGGSVGKDLDTSPVLPARDRDLGSGQDQAELPMDQKSWDGPYHSTPSSDNDTLDQLSDIICRLGSQIGESIAAKRMSNGSVGNTDKSVAPSHNKTTKPCDSHSTLSDNAQMNVAVKSEKEPVIFRCDDTDEYIVI